MTRLIRQILIFCGPEGIIHPGTVYPCEAGRARQLVKMGAAEYLDHSPPEETTMMTPETEKAIPKSRKKGRHGRIG